MKFPSLVEHPASACTDFLSLKQWLSIIFYFGMIPMNFPREVWVFWSDCKPWHKLAFLSQPVDPSELPDPQVESFNFSQAKIPPKNLKPSEVA